MTLEINCAHFNNNECHSCVLMDTPYEQGLASKVTKLEELFPAGVEAPVMPTSLRASRNKAKMAVLGTLEDPFFGFTSKKGIAHAVEQCPLHLPDINTLMALIKEHIPRFKLTPYDIKMRTGELKYLLISQSEYSHEMMLRFVVRSTESVPRLEKLTRQILLPHFKNLTVVSINLQPEAKAVLEGESERYITEKTTIHAPLASTQLCLGTRSFFQVTSSVALKLYSKVAQLLDDVGCTSVLDLYCGVGAFALFAAAEGRRVTGVELSEEAISCARKSSNNNTYTSVFVADDVEHFIESTSETFDAVIINPPRRGLNATIIAHILRIDPQYIIYSSCNALTLKRDIEELESAYAVGSITPFDMFPLTNHLECLALLHKK